MIKKGAVLDESFIYPPTAPTFGGVALVPWQVYYSHKEG
jgi:hypothetical protein